MTLEIGMLLFPDLTQLDLTGPYEVLVRIPGARVHLIAKHAAPVISESGLAIVPTTTFREAPDLDVLFVPGGSGQITANEDAETVTYVQRTCAEWISSACTGALLLGVAGHLRGYRAATHWAFMDLLPLVGAIPVDERVVVDRDRITGGGITAGIDIALVLAGRLAGKDAAESIELQLEYAPRPPFGTGRPELARPEIVEAARRQFAPRHAARKAQLERLAKRS